MVSPIGQKPVPMANVCKPSGTTHIPSKDFRVDDSGASEALNHISPAVLERCSDAVELTGVKIQATIYFSEENKAVTRQKPSKIEVTVTGGKLSASQKAEIEKIVGDTLRSKATFTGSATSITGSIDFTPSKD